MIDTGISFGRFTEYVDILDSQRVPVNSRDRAKRKGDIPYYGATGQVDCIDDYLFNEELVLLGEDGAPFLDPCKNKAYLISGKSWVNNHAHVLRGKNGLSNRLLMYWLNSVNYKEYVGGTTRYKLNQAKMKEIPIPAMSSTRQEQLVGLIEAQFTRLDSAIKSLRMVKAKLELYRKSVLKTAFSNKLIVLKASWRLFKIKEIAHKVQYGLTSKSGREYSGPKYLRITDIQNRKVNWETVPLAKEKNGVAEYRLNKGDVVFARTGATVGKSFLIDECPQNAVFASYLIRIIPDLEKIDPALLWFYFQSPMYWHKISESQRGIGQPNVNGAILSDLEINLPITIKDQKVLRGEIESRISVIDKIEEIIDKNLAKTDVLRRSILKSAFEGKLVN